MYERSGKNMFWPIKNSGEVLSKLKDIGYQATSLSTYDFSTLYTTLPHNLIKDITFGLVRMYVTPYRFSWTIFILGVALSYTDKLLVFRWVQIVLLL